MIVLKRKNTRVFKMLRLYQILALCLKFNLFTAGMTQSQHKATRATQLKTITVAKHTFVMFDPNVSILDMQNIFRYTVTDQIPLVRQVTTKFTKLFILLSEIDLKENLRTSLSQSALAVAEYNKLLSPTERKLEVWLAYGALNPDHPSDENFLYHKEPYKTIQVLNYIAQQSNSIHNGTVTTILLPYKLLNKHIDVLVSVNRSLAQHFRGVQQWGILLEADILNTQQYGVISNSIFKLNPNVIIITLQPFIEIQKPANDMPLDEWAINKLIGLSRSRRVGFLIRSMDTDITGKVNMSKLVSTWHLANNWSQQTNNTVILAKAFDTPYEDTTERKTDGWWRLLESSKYNSSVNYRFEEKALVATQYDLNTEISFSLLNDTISFSKDHVEVIFSMFDPSRAKNFRRFTDPEVRMLLKHLVANFKSIWLVFHDDTDKGIIAFIYELECLNRNFILAQIEINILVFPNIDLKKVFKFNFSLDYVEKQAPGYLKILSSIKAYVVPFEDKESLNSIKNTYLNSSNALFHNFGNIFNVSSCSSYFATGTEKELKAVEHYLKENDISIIMFYFEEDAPTVRLGAERMFQQRVVTLEQCRKLVSKWNLTIEPTLKFILLHYSTDTKFYTNRWEMANFIEYWRMLGTWAKESNTSVILSNLIDAYRYSPRLAARYQLSEPYITELGWWRLRGETEEVNDNNMWINKVDDAILKFPDENTSESVSLTTSQILLIVFSCLITAVVVVAIVLYWRRKGKVEVLLTKGEVNEFYNGMQGRRLENNAKDSPYKMPYEKSLYEICSDAFTIDYENKIGSGQFGMVNLGKIELQNEIVNVAVKMMNPSNINKSALKGLLSEIKVLSYIGKHEHVIQMMGANTQNLKFGKVYIFLELCELGSLEKYLGKMKMSLENEQGDEMSKEATLLDDRTKQYLELVSMKRKSLDLIVLEDLLRWSHEICKGMAYLASKHVVHADLATRNVLLSANKEAKICDFGLSRRMYNYTNYVKQQQEPLPWKWMAPESLKIRVFSEKSDVWAYGITIWEIFSLGEDPYPGLTWNVEFASMLEDGLRMDQPKYDNGNMYWIMKECWSTKPYSRPSFAELLAIFD